MCIGLFFYVVHITDVFDAKYDVDSNPVDSESFWCDHVFAKFAAFFFWRSVISSCNYAQSSFTLSIPVI